LFNQTAIVLRYSKPRKTIKTIQLVKFLPIWSFTYLLFVYSTSCRRPRRKTNWRRTKCRRCSMKPSTRGTNCEWVDQL